MSEVHTHAAHTAADFAAPPELGRLQLLAIIAAVVGLALTAVGALLDHEQFFHSYLVGYVFWVGVSAGCLALLMVQHLAGGAWGVVIRRVLESASSPLMMVLLLLLFIPVVLGAHDLYEWTHAEAVRTNEILKWKAPYLNLPFFIGRTILYFAIWGALAYFLNVWSNRQDEDVAHGYIYERRMRTLSGPGIVLFALTVTFASVDWVMALDPEWYSTIFGILFMGGWGLSALAFVIAVSVFLSGRRPMHDVLAPAHFHDLGKLLLAFVMLWAYFSFSQLLIIWSGNLPEEIPWYLRRYSGGWQVLSIALIVLHFMLPFLLLLSRDLKRNARLLGAVALFVIVMRVVDVFWLIAPEAHHREASYVGHLDPLAVLFGAAAVIGIGGVWFWLFVWGLRKRPLMPLGDPLLEKALHHGQHHH
ncbi:MAG: hypothetical protein H0V27_02580 [Pyrinomonadaceae bacterium]|nr:hypothetical protein [Pyrinomonadaceae bacterium]